MGMGLVRRKSWEEKEEREGGTEIERGRALKGENTVVHGLKVVDEGENVLMAHGDALEDGDFVAHLYNSLSALSVRI